MKKISQSDVLNAPFLNIARLKEDIGSLLVLAPHPDDESLGCGGLIRILKNFDQPVSVVFVTSGQASHPNSKTHSQNTLGKLRENEALEACKVLGVPEDNVHFLKAQDGQLTYLDDSAILSLVEEIYKIFERHDFRAVAMPWRRDPHPDHIIVSQIGDMVLSKTSNETIKIEYPIWLWRNGVILDWPDKSEVSPYRLNIEDVFTKKWKAINKHRSQLGNVIGDDPYGFVLTKELLKPFSSTTEYFFLGKRRHLNTLGEAYFEDLYSQKTDPWNFRESDYEHQKYKRSIAALGSKKYDHCLELGCSIGIQTKMLSQICSTVLAVDISKAAIETAKHNCYRITNVNFETCDVVKSFPKGKYDLIICSEVGYYLNPTDLLSLFENIDGSVQPNGKLLMVHWTPFVPDYPLSGDEVHERFMSFVEPMEKYRELVHERHDLYRLQVWEKCVDGSDK